MEVVTCLNCGEDNPEAAKFCVGCGSRLENKSGGAASLPPLPPLPPLPNEGAILPSLPNTGKTDEEKPELNLPPLPIEQRDISVSEDDTKDNTLKMEEALSVESQPMLKSREEVNLQEKVIDEDKNNKKGKKKLKEVVGKDGFIRYVEEYETEEKKEEKFLGKKWIILAIIIIFLALILIAYFLLSYGRHADTQRLIERAAGYN